MPHAYTRIAFALAACTWALACTTDPVVFAPESANHDTQPCLGGAHGGCAAALRVELVGQADPVQAWQTRKLPVVAGDPLQPSEVTVRLTNIAHGKRADVVKLLHVEVTSPDAGQPWSCVASGSEAPCDAQAAKWPQLVPVQWLSSVGGGVPEVQFRVRVAPKADVGHKAKVCVLAEGDPTLKNAELCFWVARAPSPPKVAVEPATVHFNGFGLKSQTQSIVVRNLGGSPLHIERVELMLPSHYTLSDGASLYVNGGDVDYAPQVVIGPGGSRHIKLSRNGGDWTDAGGTIRLFSDDPLAPGPVKVDVVATPFANTTQCLTSQAGPVIDFGAAVPGAAQKNYVVHLKNCGAAPLVVTGVALVQDPSGSGIFTIDWEHSTKADGSSPLGPTAATPIVLPSGGYVALTVTYAALNLTPETNGKLLVAVGGDTYTFTLTAQNVKVTCPIPVVTVTEGEQVVPQTTIHLKGDKSTSAGGAITKYKWSVKQPAGSNQPLTPSAGFVSPSMTANASGEYEFCLEVWDASGSKSCVAACQKVLVIPNNAIHIELLWNTPADADQTDSGPAAGADLDLHFAHPIAGTVDLDCDGKPDPWFSNPWDTFWFNAAPEWGGSGNTKDNPTMDLDDTDGAGPENLNLVDPEGTVDDPVAYRVGVHYWNDHGFGTSFATVSIYVQGGLVVQFSGVELQVLDMWYVGDLNWPNVTNGGTKPVFQTCYQSGQSCQAGKNLMWEPKGERCITKCYVNKVFNGSVGGAAKAPGC